MNTDELERLMREAIAFVRLGPLTKHEHQELDSLMTRAVNALPELLAEYAKLRERNAPPADGAGEVEAINTNDLRDYADQISNPYAQFILDAASQLDYARTDRNILQAELDAERARRVEGAASDVLAERERQKSAEGWTPDHDDEHGNGELARAAACYAHAAGLNPSARAFLEDAPDYAGEHMVITRRLWPWDRSWWKPKDRRRDLVRAGALIIAEIERLDRATHKDTQ